MRKIRTAFIWLFMINKRLYRRKGFVLFLIMIPLLAGLISAAAGKESASLNISVYAPNEKDPVIRTIFNKFENSKIKFELCTSEEEAKETVFNGKSNAAWVFPDNMKQALENYSENREPAIQIFEREDTVFLRLSREKLFAYIYPFLSRVFYYDYMINDMGQKVSFETLDRYYDATAVYDKLVNLKFCNSSETVGSTNFLLSPLRGLLALLVLICAVSSAAYFKTDSAKGTYASLPVRKQIYPELLNAFASAANTAVFVLAALAVCGLTGNILTEIAAMLMYVIMCSVFSAIIGRILKKVSLIVAVIPIIAILSVGVCPVFIAVKRLKAVKLILPLYYYLSMCFNPIFFLYGAVFILCCAVVCALLWRGELH